MLRKGGNFCVTCSNDFFLSEALDRTSAIHLDPNTPSLRINFVYKSDSHGCRILLPCFRRMAPAQVFVTGRCIVRT